MTRLLIASFTDISRDPRAIKQVRAAVDDFEVTTCSFGPPPHPDVEHIELDPDESYPTSDFMYRVDRAARRYEVFQWTFDRIPYVKSARARLAGRRFDAVVANNPDVLRAIRPMIRRARVHLDLHEYFPGLVFDDGSVEAAMQQRYLDWLLRSVARRVASSTTVSATIAERYLPFGLRPSVITNAGPSQSLAPTPTGQPIELVHSGNAQSGRGLRQLVRAATRTRTDVRLHLYLVPNDRQFHAELVELVREAGDRVVLHDPVPRDRLVATLNQHDVGVFVLPPTTINSELALPNKLFDFVQARLAIVVGPSPDMAELTRRHELGIVTDDFSEDALVRALDELAPPMVAAAKSASDRVARELSGDDHHAAWSSILRALVARRASR